METAERGKQPLEIETNRAGGFDQAVDFIESRETFFQGISKLFQISPKIFFAVLSIFNGFHGYPMGPLRKLATRDAIDFLPFKQPSEYTAPLLKKQKIGLVIGLVIVA